MVMSQLTRFREFPDSIKLPAAAILGGIATLAAYFSLALIQENRELVEHPPFVLSSGVKFWSPNFPRVIGEKKLRQDEIIAKTRGTFSTLKAFRKAPLLQTDEAVADLIQIARNSGQLRRMESSDNELDLEVWENNVVTALEIAVRFEVHRKFLESLRATIANERIGISSRREEFKEKLFDTAYSRSVFNSVVGICTRHRDHAEVKNLIEKLDQVAKDVWPYYLDTRDSLFAFDLGQAIFPIDYDGGDHRERMAKIVADIVASLDPVLLDRLLNFASMILKDEIRMLDDFVDSSNVVVSSVLSPRIIIETVFANRYSSPVTLRPIAAIRISGINGEFARLAATTVKRDLPDEERSNQFSDESPDRYATISPGEIIQVTWLGIYAVDADEWLQINGALSNGALQIELVCETLTGKRVRSIVRPEQVEIGTVDTVDRLLNEDL